MSNLLKAMEIEKEYQEYRIKDKEPYHFIDKIVELGYKDLNEYFTEKREYLFNQWIPEVYYIDINEFATAVEDAIINEKYGIYIPIADGLYAYHGTDIIDYDLCKELNVRVVELNYQGGTIIGSSEDLSIEIVMPVDIGYEQFLIISKIHEIINSYIDNVSISGNDILINGGKVMGSMMRRVGNVFVWAAQISFGEYYDIIAQICNKKSIKTPSYIDSEKLTKNKLESEVLKWLQKL